MSLCTVTINRCLWISKMWCGLLFANVAHCHNPLLFPQLWICSPVVYSILAFVHHMLQSYLLPPPPPLTSNQYQGDRQITHTSSHSSHSLSWRYEYLKVVQLGALETFGRSVLLFSCYWLPFQLNLNQKWLRCEPDDCFGAHLHQGPSYKSNHYSTDVTVTIANHSLNVFLNAYFFLAISIRSLCTHYWSWNG